MNLCELVRKYYHSDREFCLYPHRHYDGITQACSIAYNRSLTINLKFFDEKYEFQVWVGKDIINYQPSNIRKECFMLRDFIYELLMHSTEAGILMIYNVFLNALRRVRVAYDADAVYAAYAAAYAAAYDAYDAYDADAADAADAYKGMKKAFKHLIKWRKGVISE